MQGYDFIVKSTTSHQIPQRIKEEFTLQNILELLSYNDPNKYYTNSKVISITQKIFILCFEGTEKIDYNFYNTCLEFAISFYKFKKISLEISGKLKKIIQKIPFTKNQFSIYLDFTTLQHSDFQYSTATIYRILSFLSKNRHDNIYFLGIGRGCIPSLIDIVNFLINNRSLEIDFDIIPFSHRKSKEEEIDFMPEIISKIKQQENSLILVYHEDISSGRTAAISHNTIKTLINENNFLYTTANNISFLAKSKIKNEIGEDSIIR